MILKLKHYLVYKLGGFVSVDDFIGKVNKLSYQEKHKILTRAVKKSFNTVGSDDILKVADNGKWLYEGRELTETEVQHLKETAENFKNSRLYKVLDKELKYQANRRMFIDSQNVNDLVAGKLLLFLWDVVKTRLKRI